jgi:adenylosuccinate synthase
MQNSIVIDAGYGDSGVGQVVDWLSSTFEYNVIARYNGGPQAGNIVKIKKEKDITHEFQTYGSGTFRGLNTVLLPSVVFDPILLWKELLTLKEKEKMGMVKMIIDYHCPVITPYDIYLNQNSSKNLSDGTCGKGVFVTKQRELNHHHIHAIDLQYPDVLALKLLALKKAYQFPLKLEDGTEYDIDLTEFLHCANEIVNKSNFAIRSIFVEGDIYSDTIFESTQGLMLDERIGIFPHCTPSKIDIPEDQKIDKVYLVVKAYNTRHGNGPLTTQQSPVSLKKDITKEDPFQGSLRSGILDLDVLMYAIRSSNILDYLTRNKDTKLFVVFTHLDDIKSEWSYKRDGFINKFKDEEAFLADLSKQLESINYIFETRLCGTYVSNGPLSADIREFGETKGNKKGGVLRGNGNGPAPRRVRIADPLPPAEPGFSMTEDVSTHRITIDTETNGMLGEEVRARAANELRSMISGGPMDGRAIVDSDGTPISIHNTEDSRAFASQILADASRELHGEPGMPLIAADRNNVRSDIAIHPNNGQWYDEIVDRGPQFDSAGNPNPDFSRGELRVEGLRDALHELADSFAQMDAEMSDNSI